LYIDVPWDTASVPVKVERERLGDIIESKTVKVRDEAALLRGILAASDPPFREFLDQSDGSKVFIVNDATRPTPTHKVIQVIQSDLEERDISFLVATGAHRPPGESELEEIFGREVREHFLEKIFSHDSRDERQLVNMGRTSRGTPIWMNRMVAEADQLVLLNSVEPHYFAGYTGGRKSLFPGVAGFETIQTNHKMALSPQASNLALADNPVHEDMMEAVEVFADKPIYSLQMVLDRQHRIHSAHAGSLKHSFQDAVIHADDHYVVEIDHRFDVVVTVAPYPMDYDLYQSQKALENGAMALKENGVLILVSSCRHGIGDETFFNLLADASTPAQVLERVKGEYVLGYHKAARMAHIADRNEMWGVTNIPDEDMEAAFMRPFPTVQKAVDSAVNRKGPEARVLFLMDGSLTVPRIRED